MHLVKNIILHFHSLARKLVLTRAFLQIIYFELLQINYFCDELALYSSGEIFEQKNPGAYSNIGE